MTAKELGRIMGGRILESYYDYAHVSNLVYEALDLGFECIQVFPNMLPKVKEVLNGRDLEVCAVVSYPHGIFLPEQKAFEIKDAIGAGATQIEFVVHNINVRSGNWELVHDEFRACRQAAGSCVLKAILECEWLTDEMICKVCEIAVEEKIDRVCTSIGVYTRPDENKNDMLIGVEPEDVRKVKAAVQGKAKVVAQGNIDSISKCRELLGAGADYISSEYAADILRNWE